MVVPSASGHGKLADAAALREDAEARGWDSEVARHARVITSLQRHLDRLKTQHPPLPRVDPTARTG
jgi:hypothetical protein